VDLRLTPSLVDNHRWRRPTATATARRSWTSSSSRSAPSASRSRGPSRPTRPTRPSRRSWPSPRSTSSSAQHRPVAAPRRAAPPPPRRRPAPPSPRAAAAAPGTLHSATPVAARPARSARPALCSAPCSARLARTLPLQRSALSLRALSGTLRAARVQVRRPLRLHLRGRAGRERGQAGDLAQGAAACRELSRMSWWCHSSLACCPGRLGREGTFGPGLLFLGLRRRAPPPLRPQWLLSVCADAHPCRALPPTPPPTSTSHSPLPGRAG